MARTRSSKTTTTAKKTKAETSNQETTTSTSKHTLEASSPNPPNLLVLPKKATTDARIVTLPHPRTAKPSRWLVCPETGIYEFTKIAAPTSTPRSWLLTSEPPESGPSHLPAHITSHADLYVATPFDPLFLMLPALLAAGESASSRKGDGNQLFFSSEDHFDALPALASHLGEVLRLDKVKSMIEERMRGACETVDVDDEVMFRLDEKRLLVELIAKAIRMSKTALPEGMEEKFVKKALEAPLLLQKRTLTVTATTQDPASQPSTPQPEATDSQSAAPTAGTAESQVSASTAATSVTETLVTSMTASPDVVSLQRLRIAFDFICSRYVPPALASKLRDMFEDSSVSEIDFAPLATYLAELAQGRAEAHAARSMTDYSRKHARVEDSDDIRAEKRRKAEEEKRKKSQESRALKDLRKVNTTGMMKLTAFFKKKE